MSPATKPRSAAHVPFPLGLSGSRRSEHTLIPRGVFHHPFFVLIITQTDHRSAAVSCQHSCPEASKPCILSILLSHACTNVVTFKLPDGSQLNRKGSGDLRFLTQCALLKMQGFCQLWLSQPQTDSQTKTCIMYLTMILNLYNSSVNRLFILSTFRHNIVSYQ